MTTTTIIKGNKGPVLGAVEGVRKLAVPDRRSLDEMIRKLPDRNPIDHKVVVGRVVHDTNPTKKGCGVAFLEVRHADDCPKCERIRRRNAAVETYRKVNFPKIVLEVNGGKEAIIKMAEKDFYLHPSNVHWVEIKDAACRGDISFIEEKMEELAKEILEKRDLRRRAESIRPALEAILRAVGKSTSPIANGGIGPAIVRSAEIVKGVMEDRHIADMLWEITGIPACCNESVGPIRSLDKEPVVDGWVIKDGKANPVTFIAPGHHPDDVPGWDGESANRSSIPTPDDWGDFFAGGGGRSPDRMVPRAADPDEIRKVEKALAYIHRKGEVAGRINRRLALYRHHVDKEPFINGFGGFDDVSDDLWEHVDEAEAFVAEAMKARSIREFLRNRYGGDSV